MKKEKIDEKQASNELEVMQPVVIPYSVEKQEKKIVCPVCGYANSEYSALCKNCSNYL